MLKGESLPSSVTYSSVKTATLPSDNVHALFQLDREYMNLGDWDGMSWVNAFYWLRESQFSLGMLPYTPVDNPTPLHNIAALSRLRGFKKEYLMLG